MKQIVVALLALLICAAAAKKPKFTADQCRVLRQVGVDTTEICKSAFKKSLAPNKPRSPPRQRVTQR